jgi:hypothetical protein
MARREECVDRPDLDRRLPLDPDLRDARLQPGIHESLEILGRIPDVGDAQRARRIEPGDVEAPTGRRLALPANDLSRSIVIVPASRRPSS